MAHEPRFRALACVLFIKWAMQRLNGQQVTLPELSYLLRLLTDLANFLHAYVDLNGFDDFESYEFASLFVCLFFFAITHAISMKCTYY